MRPLIEKARALSRGSFVRNVSIVAMGLAVAQAISLAFTPILTRIYGPEAYGVLGTYTAIVGIIMPLSTLSYASAIVLPKDDRDALAVAHLAQLVCLCVSALVVVAIVLGGPSLIDVMRLEAIPAVIFFIPVSIILSGWFSTTFQLAIRTKQFKARSLAHVESTLITNLARLGGGLWWPSGATMIAIFALTPAVGAWLLSRRTHRHADQRGFDWTRIKSVAYEHKDFALLRMPQGVLNATAVGLPVLLLTSMFGPSCAGQYSLAMLVLGAPVMLFGQSVGEVFYPKIASAAREPQGRVGQQIRKATATLGAIGVLILAPVFIFGPDLFEFAFGASWSKAGGYSQWLAVWLITVLINRPSVTAIPVLKMQGVLLGYELLLTAARVLSLVGTAHLFADDMISVAAFATVGAAANLALVLLVYLRTRGI